MITTTIPSRIRISARNFNMEPTYNYMVKLWTACNQRIYKGSIKIGKRYEYKS